MPVTPDRKPGPLQEDDHIRLYSGGDPGTGLEGVIRYVDSPGHFEMEDESGAFDPRAGGGLTPAEHEALDTLVHRLSETCYTEITRSNGRVTDVVVWTSAAKTTKVRETNITRTGNLISQVVEQQYDAAGSLVQTLTHAIARSGGRVESIATTETTP